MDAKIIGGKAFGIPAGGTIINLNSADITAILSSAAGLAKSLFSFAGKGLLLSAGLVGLYLALSSNKEYKGMRLGVMSKIDTGSRKFYGICVDEMLTAYCGGEKLLIPTEYINYIARKTFFFRDSELEIVLFDGSIYKWTGGGETSLSFLTTVGKQSITMGQHYSNLGSYGCISGGTVQERDSLITGLNNFLEEKDESIVNLMGKEKFEKFFYPSK
jgi:hypothetical protein